MPITAFSNAAQRELDLAQWLALSGHAPTQSPLSSDLPTELRAKAAIDIECSCCGATGATLVRSARSKGVGKLVGQGHFRFTNDGQSAHDPFCDYYDEQKITGGEFLTNFASDKSALTKTIRDLVCRGIVHQLFTQADMRQMRMWFMQEKAKHALVMDVTPDLLRWCVDMQSLHAHPANRLPFRPNYGQLPGFNWQQAAEVEWLRRNADLFVEIDRGVYFQRRSIERPIRLVSQFAGKTVLNPIALRDKYASATKLSIFAAENLYDVPEKKASPIERKHPSVWGAVGHALLALSALLLFMSDWDLDGAASLFVRLRKLPPAADVLAGNLIGLNPFHDYDSWLTIDSARKIGEKRRDSSPVSDQITTVMVDIQAQYLDWAGRQTS